MVFSAGGGTNFQDQAVAKIRASYNRVTNALQAKAMPEEDQYWATLEAMKEELGGAINNLTGSNPNH